MGATTAGASGRSMRESLAEEHNHVHCMGIGSLFTSFFPYTWWVHGTRLNQVINKVFLNWRDLRKPYTSTPSFIMHEKANNLPRNITQVKVRVETVVLLASSARLFLYLLP